MTLFLREARKPVLDVTFSDAERERRWSAVREQMAARGLSAMVVYGDQAQYVHANQNLRWMTNAATEGFLVFPAKGEPAIVAFESPVLEEPWVSDWRGGWPTFGTAVAKVLEEQGLGSARVGMSGAAGLFGELGGFPYRSWQVLTQELPSLELVEATDLIDDLRAYKSPEEIAVLEAGCSVAQKVSDAVVATAGVGVLDAEVRAAIVETLVRNGCEPAALLVYNQGRELIHAGDSGMWNESGFATPLSDGDVILLEVDCSVLGYKGQFNFSFTVGEVDEEWQRLFDCGKRAYEAGVAVLRPGIRALELEEAILDVIREDGFDWGNPPFHGLGLGLEEPIGSYPRANFYLAERDVVLEAGRVMELEPHPVTKDGRKGVSTGGPLLITPDGSRSLAPWYVAGPRAVEGPR